MDKTVRIGVNSQAAERYSSKMKESSKQYFDQMIKDYRNAEISSNKIISNLREEISLRREKGRLQREEERFQIQKFKEEGQISDKGFSTRIDSLSKRDRSEERQIKIMQDILDATVLQTRELIKSDRRSVEKFVKATEKDIRKGVEVTDEQFLRYNISKELLEKQKRGGGFIPISGGGGDLSGIVGGAAGGNVGGLVAGLLSFLPAGRAARVLMGLTATGAVTAGAVGSIEEELSRYAVATQTPIGVAKARLNSAPFGGSALLGLSDAEFYNMQVSAIMGKGGGRLSSTEALRLAGAGAARGIDTSMMGRTYESFRYSNRAVDPITLFATLEKFLKETGQPLSRLPEVLDTYLQRSQDIISRTGSVNAMGLEQSMLSISRSFGVSGTNLNRYVAGFERMGMRSQNPAMQAMQLQTLARMYPEKDLFELQTMMESPLEHPDYLQTLMKDVERYSGGKGTMMHKFGLKAITGLSGKDVENMIRNDYQTYFPNKDDQEIKSIMGSYPAQGKEFVGSVKQVEKTLASGFQRVVGEISSLIGKLEDMENYSLEHPEQKKALESTLNLVLNTSPAAKMLLRFLQNNR